jgi:dienelactone hydrolase
MLLGLSRSACAQVDLTTYTGTFPDGATYLIEVPPHWNGTLFLYSHGYMTEGTPNPAVDNFDLLVRLYLFSHGYAQAGSSYASTGWAIQDAFRDQIAVLDRFDLLVGHPKRTIAWGFSMGGAITAGLVQNFPDRFSGAAPFCGVLGGSVGFWNQWLDSAFAFKTLLASGSKLQVVHIADPVANLGIAQQLLTNAQASPKGRARIALVSALIDLSGWFDPSTPQPNPNDYATLEANQFASLSGQGGFGDFFFFFAFRAELEKRAGGNPSWNTGVDYEKQLRLSINHAEVRGLYRRAGLSLDTDLKTLKNAARIAANPAAANYLSQNVIFNGKIEVPVLTVHTTGDDAVTVQDEQAYTSVVHRAHEDSLLRSTFVHRAGHCQFTSAEMIAALEALLHRLDTGEWRSVDPEDLNAAALRLAPVYNFLPPSFVRYESAPFLRPFNVFDDSSGSR